MASFSGLDEPFAGGVVVLGYCLLLAWLHNKGRKRSCTARKNGNRATTNVASSGNMSAALGRSLQRLEVVVKCYLRMLATYLLGGRNTD